MQQWMKATVRIETVILDTRQLALAIAGVHAEPGAVALPGTYFRGRYAQVMKFVGYSVSYEQTSPLAQPNRHTRHGT